MALLLFAAFSAAAAGEDPGEARRAVVSVTGGPDNVLWVVQLSDLHFSRHHPARAREFRERLSSALAVINPSLVLITGDLVDGKSKDMLTSKQDENEWMEYRSALNEVIDRSRLNNEIFYDLRGNHDMYGIPTVGGMHDYFEEHSVNARLGRRGFVHSITLQLCAEQGPKASFCWL